MANLIITVISIALVAVAALIGAYYGGAAYTAGMMNARVNSVTEELKQVAAAIQLYKVNNNNNSPVNTSALVPNYLTQLPTRTHMPLYGGATNPTLLNIYNIDTTTGVGTQNLSPINAVGFSMNSVNQDYINLCIKFAESKGDAGAMVSSTLNSLVLDPTALATKQWFCKFRDYGSNPAAPVLGNGNAQLVMLYVFR